MAAVASLSSSRNNPTFLAIFVLSLSACVVTPQTDHAVRYSASASPRMDDTMLHAACCATDPAVHCLIIALRLTPGRRKQNTKEEFGLEINQRR